MVDGERLGIEKVKTKKQARVPDPVLEELDVTPGEDLLVYINNPDIEGITIHKGEVTP